MTATARTDDAAGRARNPLLYRAQPTLLRTGLAPAVRPHRYRTGTGLAPRLVPQATRQTTPASLAYFFSGSGFGCGLAGTVEFAPPGANGKVANIDFAWFCICSCICTNMFFDCSM